MRKGALATSSSDADTCPQRLYGRYRPVNPACAKGGLLLGILHYDGPLSGVMLPARIDPWRLLGWRRFLGRWDRQHSLRSVAPDAVRSGVGRAGTGSAASGAGTGLERSAPAIVQAFLPGMYGGDAIVDCLFGDYNPGGKLSTTFPKTTGQLELNFPTKPGANVEQTGRNPLSVTGVRGRSASA